MTTLAIINGVRRPAKGSCSCGCQDCALARGAALYKTFSRFDSTRVVRVKHARVMPTVVVELGRLAGVIYRSDKGRRDRPRTYVHFMEHQPRLVSNTEGTQLYIVGGRYRVGARGIEG